MYLFKQVNKLQDYLKFQRSSGKKIGFVPTMGALHEGHLSLIRYATADNECVVCSIFVNPTQFNETADLDKYPRTPAKDVELLLKVGTTVLFMPTATEIYPKDYKNPPIIDFGLLDKVMEGAHRPGHFDGVAQVVEQLLQIVQPDRLYMGRKDYQQLQIINHLIRVRQLPIELIGCPIKRAPNGLALSSRNVRLSSEQTQQATQIYQTLLKAKEMIRNQAPIAVQKWALTALKAAGLEPEYFEIVHADTLKTLPAFEENKRAIACTAVWAGEVRLIDNLLLN